MASIVMALIMGVLGGPALALAIRAPKRIQAYELAREKSRRGDGPDPDKAPLGPHKSFAQNAVIFGLIFGCIGFFIGTLG